jgi:hypothetical protein
MTHNQYRYKNRIDAVERAKNDLAQGRLSGRFCRGRGLSFVRMRYSI